MAIHAPSQPGPNDRTAPMKRLDFPPEVQFGPDFERFRAYGHRLGPAVDPPDDAPYRVQFVKVGSLKRRIITKVIVMMLTALVFTFAYVVLHPHFTGSPGYASVQGSWPRHILPDIYLTLIALCRWTGQIITASNFTALAGPLWYRVAEVGADICVICLTLFILLNVVTLAYAANSVRDPVPVTPPRSLKIAFVMTAVPSKEPPEMIRRTIRAAVAMAEIYVARYGGLVDVFVCDEEDDAVMRQVCTEEGAKHFSRKHWNKRGLGFVTGTFKMKTKFGNLNSWWHDHGANYDIMTGVDPDHVPFSWYLDRMMGYFCDPNVAYVAAPQFYENRGTFLERAVESAQFVFHSLLQKSGNRWLCTMLVGTNYAIRLSALEKGFAATITEDLGTALDILCRRNRKTGKRWRAVYTSDMVALGLGPRNFTELTKQQGRWAGGTFQSLREQRLLFKVMFKMNPFALVHYALQSTYYPSVAIGWLMSMYVTVCYLGLGMSPLHANSVIWRAGYLDIAALQLLLYWFSRQLNVSPFEDKYETGWSGMLISALMAPVFTQAFLVNFVLGRDTLWNVTPKTGDDEDPDRLLTFKTSLAWSVIPLAALAVGVERGTDYPLVDIWAGIDIAICLLPVIIWRLQRLQKRHRGSHTRRRKELR